MLPLLKVKVRTQSIVLRTTFRESHATRDVQTQLKSTVFGLKNYVDACGDRVVPFSSFTDLYGNSRLEIA